MKARITKILILLLVVFLVSSLTLLGISCKTETVPEEEPMEEAMEEEAMEEEPMEEEAMEEEAEKEPVTLRFSSILDKEKIDKELVSRYMELNPHVTINVDITGDINQYKDLSPQVFGSTDAPDIAWYWFDAQSPNDKMVQAGILEPLNDIIEPEMEANLPESIKDFYKSWGLDDGLYYAMPEAQVLFPVIYYNKTMFAEAGIEAPDGEFVSSLDAMYDIVAKLEAAGMEPLGAGFLDGWIVGHYLNAMMQNGVSEEILADLKVNWAPGSEGKYSFENEEVIATFKVMKEFYDNVYSDSSLGLDYTSGRGSFINGTTAMYQDGHWGTASIRGEMPEGFDFGWFYWPKIGSKDPQILTYAGNSLQVPAIGENKEVAKDFVKFCGTRESQLVYAEYGQLPIRTDISVEELTEILGYPVSDMLRFANEGGVATGYTSNIPAEIVQVVFSSIQEMLIGSKTAEEAAKAIQDLTVEVRERDVE